MRTNQPWNQRWTVLEKNQDDSGQTFMTNLELTVRAEGAVSACRPLPLSIKVLAHWLSVGGVSLWTDVHPSHSPLTSICCLVTKCVTLCDPMDCSLQSPLSMGFSRQEYWGGLLFPSTRKLSEAGLNPHPQPLLSSKIKQTFLSINLTSLMTFEQQAARP